MMDCTKARQLLSEWVDGRLAGMVGSALEGHLRDCAPCREEEKLLRGTWEILGQYPSIEPSPFFVQQVTTRARRPALWKILAPVAAAAAVIVLSIVFLVSPSKPPIEPPVTAEERELMDNLELLENYDIVSALELVADESAAEGHLFKEDPR